MDRRLNVGVVGVSTWHGVKQHLERYLACRNAKVVAVSDAEEGLARSVAKEYGIGKFFTDYRDLLALKEVDAVSICLPPFTHADITCDAAAAGKHVLCEKPMAMNPAQALRMIEACKKAGVKLGICQSRCRFIPAIEMAKSYVSAGKLGTVYYARFSAFRRRRRPGLEMLESEKWFLDSSKAGGGALTDIGCYDLDLILYLLGHLHPSSVSAMTFHGVGAPVDPSIRFDVEEHASLFVRFQGGPVATFETAWHSNMDRGQRLVLFGTEGGLKLELFDPQRFTYFTERDGEHVAVNVDMTKSVEPVIDDFVMSCLDDRAPKASGEDGLTVMRILGMAYASARLGREITFDELEQNRGSAGGFPVSGGMP